MALPDSRNLIRAFRISSIYTNSVVANLSVFMYINLMASSVAALSIASTIVRILILFEDEVIGFREAKGSSIPCSVIVSEKSSLSIADAGTTGVVSFDKELTIPLNMAKDIIVRKNIANKDPINEAKRILKNFFMMMFLMKIIAKVDIIINFAKMNKIFTYCITGILVFCYIIATVGFGVHECATSGSRDIVPLYGDLSCEMIHKTHTHAHEGDHDCSCGACGGSEHQDEHHDNSCCSTKVIVINDNQEVAAPIAVTVPDSFLPDLNWDCESSHSIVVFSDNSSHYHYSDGPPLPVCDIRLSFISQWRL